MRIIGGFLLGLFLAASAANAALHDMVEMSVTGNPGTASFALNAAVSPYVSFATALTSGETVTYHAQDGAGNWENGRGVWTSGGGGTLTRATILTSSNANAIVNFSTTSPTVFITAAAEDMLTGVYPNIELSLNSQPLCPLTDTATVLVAAGPACASDATKGIAYDSLTLTANGHVLGCPTGATVSGSGILFRINEGSGPFKISPAGCYYFPNTGALDSQGNLVFSGIAKGINQFYCQLQGISTGNGFPVQYECGAILAGLGSATDYLVGTPTLTSCSNGVTSCAATASFVNGDEALIFAGDCGNNINCSSGTLVTVSSASGTGFSGCTKFTGAEGIGNGLGVHWLYCAVTSTGSLTVTVNYASAVQGPVVVLFDLHNVAASPDAGIGNFATGNSTAPSVATNGNTQQSNGFIVSGIYPAVSETWTPGGTAILTNSGALVQDNVVYAPGSSATASATMGVSGLWTISVAQVLHK